MVEYAISPRARIVFQALREKLDLTDDQIIARLVESFAELDPIRQSELLESEAAKAAVSNLPSVQPFALP